MNPKTDSKQAVRTASTLPVISGLRLTKQRQEVYQVLLEQRDHPTANEVYQRVRKNSHASPWPPFITAWRRW